MQTGEKWGDYQRRVCNKISKYFRWLLTEAGFCEKQTTAKIR